MNPRIYNQSTSEPQEPLNMSVLPTAYINQLAFRVGGYTAPSIVSVGLGSRGTMPTPTLILSTKTFLLLGSFHLLYHLGPSIVQWRFPCQSAEQIDIYIRKIESIIDSNSYLENDVLGDTFDGFKAWLEELCDKAHELKIRACREPSRVNLVAWGIYRWRFLCDLDVCYQGLKELEGEIEETIRTARIARLNARRVEVV